MKTLLSRHAGVWLLLVFIGVTTIVYWPGLSGGWLFDDYPNIVDNHDVQPHALNVSSIWRAALSSPSSEFKRPLSSLSFAINYLATGLDPWSWKLFNLVLHLLNGVLVFLLARLLLQTTPQRGIRSRAQALCRDTCRFNSVAAVVAGGWMLLPINITAVLYVVQRMESIANLFVLLGLTGYIIGRRHMLATTSHAQTEKSDWAAFALCASSLILATAVGLQAKETAVMLPLYAVLTEWIVFGFGGAQEKTQHAGKRMDWRIIALFLILLVLPMIAGLAWLLPRVINPQAWVSRDFTMHTRLLSEARIVIDYMVWTLLPTPQALSFYHDDFHISTGLFQPWTTLACMLVLVTLTAATVSLRKQRPLIALGLAWFLGCHLLTATILPLELIFEHRNYFASLGLMLAITPLLLSADLTQQHFKLACRALLGGLLLLWAAETMMTSLAWGNPLDLAESYAARAPLSPRAQYELGRTLIIYSRYDPSSPFTRLAYAPLERSAALPGSSILPEQALIFMNAHMHLPIKNAWWDSLIAKLKAHKPGVQDESSLMALTQCARDRLCNLPQERMVEAFLAALSHPNPSARLLAAYGDYAWNVLDDQKLGLRMTKEAVQVEPHEPAYHITMVRMLAALGSYDQAHAALQQLQPLNIGGRLNGSIKELQGLLPNSGTK